MEGEEGGKEHPEREFRMAEALKGESHKVGQGVLRNEFKDAGRTDFELASQGYSGE